MTHDLRADLLSAVAITRAIEAGDYAAFNTLTNPADVASMGGIIGAFARLLRSQAEDIADLAPQQFADADAVLAHMVERIVNGD